MPKKSAGDLVLSGRRTRRTEPPRTTGQLTWAPTEFGRRSTDGRFRVVRSGTRWLLLNVAWEVLATCDTITEAQDRAERHA